MQEHKHILLWRPQTLGFDPVLKKDSLASIGDFQEPKVEVKSLDQKDLREASGDPRVASIAPVMPTKLIWPTEVLEAPAEAMSWGIAAVKAKTSPYMGRDVVVCVLDTGIDLNHLAFQGVNFVHEDFSGDGIADALGHGTHCAGTIFGRDVDGTRIGVAPGISKALVGKVLKNDGRGDSSMIFRGIQWALDQRADVVSMSLDFDFASSVGALIDQGWPVDLATSVSLDSYCANRRMFEALMAMVHALGAFNQGTVLIAASGNESERGNGRIVASVPGAIKGLISVGAVNSNYSIADFSNRMPTLIAPGVRITSAKLGGGLCQMSGTSMACSHVAGVAALWWEAMRGTSSDGRSSAAQIEARLVAAAQTNMFKPDAGLADRGAGLVTAPPTIFSRA